MRKKEKMLKVLEILKKKHSEVKTMLNYTTPFELLIAVILSAQCTDKRVNIVTEKMYKLYNTAEEFSKIDIEELESLVKSTGFYRNKAKNIKKCSKQLIDDFNGELPKTISELITLAGVGRKTANVVLGHIFDIKDGIVVDTHVKRLSKRIGFTKEEEPVKVETDLLKIVPYDDRFVYSNLLILHGRDTCKARKPLCKECILNEYCNYWRIENDT